MESLQHLHPVCLWTRAINRLAVLLKLLEPLVYSSGIFLYWHMFSYPFWRSFPLQCACSFMSPSCRYQYQNFLMHLFQVIHYCLPESLEEYVQVDICLQLVASQDFLYVCLLNEKNDTCVGDWACWKGWEVVPLPSPFWQWHILQTS